MEYLKIGDVAISTKEIIGASGHDSTTSKDKVPTRTKGRVLGSMICPHCKIVYYILFEWAGEQKLMAALAESVERYREVEVTTSFLTPEPNQALIT